MKIAYGKWTDAAYVYLTDGIEAGGAEDIIAATRSR
jgi:uncharacterized protein YuzE